MSSSFISISKPAAGSAATGMRVWLFHVLVLVAAALFVVSWVIPWWRSNIQEAGMFVQIRPWGLEHTLGNYVEYMGGDPRMPGFFAPLMWAYLVLAIAALLVSLFLKERTIKIGKFAFSLPQFLVFAVGASYIIFALVFLVYAYIRVSALGVEFLGISYVTIPEFHLGAESISDFEPGFKVACVVGPLCVVLALLRDKIIGKPKVNA